MWCAIRVLLWWQERSPAGTLLVAAKERHHEAAKDIGADPALSRGRRGARADRAWPLAPNGGPRHAARRLHGDDAHRRASAGRFRSEPERPRGPHDDRDLLPRHRLLQPGAVAAAGRAAALLRG